MSELLPDFDIEMLASFVKPAEQFDAVMEFRDRFAQPPLADQIRSSRSAN
ncbi:hypothetical protein [Leptolyngbya ohadii]|nr:hypothetical protein [Leptolyngbya ohadii]